MPQVEGWGLRGAPPHRRGHKQGAHQQESHGRLRGSLAHLPIEDAGRDNLQGPLGTRRVGGGTALDGRRCNCTHLKGGEELI